MIRNTLVCYIVGLLLLNAESSSAQALGDFISQQITNQVSRSTSNAISKNLSDNLIIPQLKIRNESGEVKDFSISSDGRLFSLLHEDGTIRVWDSKQGIQRPTLSPGGKTFTHVLSVSSADTTLAGHSDGSIEIFDVVTGKSLSLLPSHNADIAALTLSSDESVLLAAYQNGTVIGWDLKKFIPIKQIATPYGDALKFLALMHDNANFIAAGENGFIDSWNLISGEKTKELPPQQDDIVALWLDRVSGELVTLDTDGFIQLIDPARDGAVQNKKVSSQDILSMAVSFESNTIALATEDQTIKLLSLPDMAPVKELKAGDDISHLKFINRGEQLIGADPKGVLHVFDVGSATEILKLISTETGWTVVDSTGRFDSSEAGMGNVSWEAAEQDIPIDSFSTHYYEPGVMATALAHEPFINKQPQVVQAGINLPPELNLNAPGASKTADQPFIIALDVVDAGGGIGAQRLYHNGKIVDESRVLDKVDSEIDGRLNRRIRYQVPPVPGRNQFKALVANLMGIDSPARELAFDVSGEKTPSTLHVIAVGINQYKDQRLNLDYSVADAKSIAAILKTKKLMSFKNIHELGLFDQNATKQAIIGRLKESANYPKEDVLVVYLAGHGLAINGEWYFMPHETTLQETEHEYAEIGISAQEIRDLMAEINMQKILILVDACYSGAGLNAFRYLQNSQRHFGRALSKSVGIVILAATRQDQQAAELADLGHGLFTYVVSQGMEGAADIRPKNQIISAYEVADFSTSTIPEYSKKYLGASQEPSAFTMGSDFVLLGQ